MFDQEEDLKLIDKILNGNVHSFEKLLSRYELPVIKFIYSIVRDVQIAEDISQEVFLKVYDKLDTFDKKYKFSNWILRIARNKCIDHIRKSKKVNESNIEDIIGIQSKVNSPESILEFKEEKRIIEGFINNLNFVDKQIVFLRYSDKLTFKDISEVVGISESSARRKYYKVIDKLKEYLCMYEKGCEYEV